MRMAKPAEGFKKVSTLAGFTTEDSFESPDEVSVLLNDIDEDI